MQRFHKIRLLNPFPFSTWDIGLVLHALTLAPFESLVTVSLEAVTYKTFCFSALALGARRGELCAFRRGQFIRPAEDWSFVLLYSDPSFIPNTVSLQSRTSSGPSRLVPLQ